MTMKNKLLIKLFLFKLYTNFVSVKINKLFIKYLLNKLSKKNKYF